MQVVDRRGGESIEIPDRGVTLTVVRVGRDDITVVVDGPPEMSVTPGEECPSESVRLSPREKPQAR